MRKFLSVASIGLLFFSIGCGTNTVDKSSFSDVSAFLHKDQPLLAFKNVVVGSNRTTTVFVNLSNVSIDLDSSLLGTALTIVPDFSDRLLPSSIAVNAARVTVWVQSEQEKTEWDLWLKTSDEQLLREYSDRYRYQKVIPR